MTRSASSLEDTFLNKPSCFLNSSKEISLKAFSSLLFSNNSVRFSDLKAMAIFFIDTLIFYSIYERKFNHDYLFKKNPFIKIR